MRFNTTPVSCTFLTHHLTSQVLFLNTGRILKMKNLYIVTVIVGLVIHGLVVLPLLFFMVTKKNPYSFMSGQLQALVTALGTSSRSSSALGRPIFSHYEPSHLLCLQLRHPPRHLLLSGGEHSASSRERPVWTSKITLHASKRWFTCFFFLKLLCCLFVSLHKSLLSPPPSHRPRSITATAARIGAAGIPQAGLVTMVIVLASVGLPVEDIGPIIAVDWFLWGPTKCQLVGDRARVLSCGPAGLNVTVNPRRASRVPPPQRLSMHNAESQTREARLKKWGW